MYIAVQASHTTHNSKQKGAMEMHPEPEPPTRIYEPKPSDTARIAELSQSNAPMKIYTPPVPRAE